MQTWFTGKNGEPKTNLISLVRILINKRKEKVVVFRVLLSFAKHKCGNYGYNDDYDYTYGNV